MRAMRRDSWCSIYAWSQCSAKIQSPRSWQYDRELYKKRNEIERLFRRLKGFRRIFSRFEKLDIIFLGFINFVLIVEPLDSVNTP